MMEELKLLTNRGSRMFHERLRRVDKFILENAGRASGKVWLFINTKNIKHVLVFLVRLSFINELGMQ